MPARLPADREDLPLFLGTERAGMTSRFCTVLATAVVFATDALSPLSADSRRDQPPPAFRAAADVVTIQASVRDARGRMLGGLPPNDFEVRDNGELRRILS